MEELEEGLVLSQGWVEEEEEGEGEEKVEVQKISPRSPEQAPLQQIPLQNY